MKKLRLDLGELRVETFETAEEKRARGTVAGQATSLPTCDEFDPVCAATGAPTCEHAYTCINTDPCYPSCNGAQVCTGAGWCSVYGSCNGTCDNSCGGTCGTCNETCAGMGGTCPY